MAEDFKESFWEKMRGRSIYGDSSLEIIGRGDMLRKRHGKKAFMEYVASLEESELQDVPADFWGHKEALYMLTPSQWIELFCGNKISGAAKKAAFRTAVDNPEMFFDQKTAAEWEAMGYPAILKSERTSDFVDRYPPAATIEGLAIKAFLGMAEDDDEWFELLYENAMAQGRDREEVLSFFKVAARSVTKKNFNAFDRSMLAPFGDNGDGDYIEGSGFDLLTAFIAPEALGRRGEEDSILSDGKAKQNNEIYNYWFMYRNADTRRAIINAAINTGDIKEFLLYEKLEKFVDADPIACPASEDGTTRDMLEAQKDARFTPAEINRIENYLEEHNPLGR